MNSWEDLARSQGDHCTPPNTLHLGERSFTLPLPLLVPLLVPLLLLLLLPRLLLPPPLWLLVLSLLLRLLLPVGRTNPYCYCCRCCGFAFMLKQIGKTARPRKSTHIALMTEFWRERFSRCRRPGGHRRPSEPPGTHMCQGNSHKIARNNAFYL